MRISRITGIFLLWVIGLTGYSLGDHIYLKSGNTIQGVIVSEDEQFLNIRTEVGVMAIPKSHVVSMEKESPAMNQLRAGDSYMARGEWEKARAQYEAALQMDTTLTIAKTKIAEIQIKIEEAAESKLAPTFQEGDRLLERKRFEEAVKFFTDLLNLNASGDLSSAIRRRLAKTYYLWGRDRLDRASKYEAVDQLKKAISFNPSYADAHILLADISKELANKEQEAILYYTTGIRLKPSHWQAYFNRGEVYIRTNEIEKGIDDFLVVYQNATSTLVKMAADRLMQSYSIMGKSEGEKQQWNNAISDFEKAIQYKNDSAGVYYDLADAYSQIKNYQRVTTALYRAIQLDGTYADAYQLLGDTFVAMGNYSDAVTPYRRALLLKPDNYRLMCSLAEVYLKQGLYNDATDLCQRAIRIDPNIAPAYYYLGLVYDKKDLNDDAFRSLQKAVDIKPDDIRFRLAFGQILKKMKRYEEALNEFRTASKINPQSTEARNEIGLTNMALGNYFNAIYDFQATIEIDSSYVQAYVNLGDAHRLKKNYEEAIESYNKAIRINPNYPESYLGLGIIAHDYQKDFAGAMVHYKNYLAHGGKMTDQLQQWMKEVETLQAEGK